MSFFAGSVPGQRQARRCPGSLVRDGAQMAIAAGLVEAPSDPPHRAIIPKFVAVHNFTC